MGRIGAFLVACAGAFGCVVLLYGAATAAWPTDPLVNVPLCRNAGDQYSAQSVADGAGGAIVVWADSRNGNNDLYAQRVSADGAVQWAVDGVAVCTTASDQISPSIVTDGAGGAIVIWTEYVNGGSFIDYFVQRISANGTVQWPAAGVAVCAVASFKYEVTSTSDGAGGVIIAWAEARSGEIGIFLQRVSGSGVVQWTANGLAAGAVAGAQRTPAIVSDGTGGAIVAWQDWRGYPVADLYAQRVSAAGVARWAASGVVLCAATGTQIDPVIIANGAGGAIATWADNRNGTSSDIYAQNISSEGTLQWATDGIALCTAAGQQYYPAITTDGAGGAIVAWQDPRSGGDDIYVQKLSGSGVVQWTTDGAALTNDYAYQTNPVIAPDGAGGAIVTWNDGRGDGGGIYAQRITAGGVIKWPSNGGAVCTAASYQSDPCLVPGSAGDAIFAWPDYRDGNLDIYAQGVDRSGSMFNVPRITSVRDIAGDQGGKVRVAWNRGFLDSAPSYEISLYGIWRQVSTTAAKGALAGGALLLDEAGQDMLPHPGVFRATADGDKVRYWEGVGTVAARGEPTYTFVAPTLQDSTSAGSAWTVFMVDAHLAFQPGFFDSAADSGYSVDNLAPAMPAPFTGRFLGSSTALHWGRSLAYDMAGYRLYRGDAPDFVPGPANFVVAKPDTGFVDHVDGNHYYRLYAVDIHGNLSACASLAPQQTSSVPEGPPAALRLLPNVPNPFNPMTTIQYDLPAETTVDLAIYDPRGRLIAQLKSGELEGAGRHEAIWQGRDQQGRTVGAGVYLCRLKAGSFESTRRMTVLK